ncbi:HPr family phosphocarrier protein [Myxococcota bacterium]|nr:HPr family phosphocarrier protein [Myxococcota bacterium]
MSAGGPPSAARFFRVDPRLIHATLMNAWVPHVGAKHLVVVDDDVVMDPRFRTILEMSAMETPLSFVREEDARATVHRIPPSSPVIVLFSSLAGAERAINGGLDVAELNIGHLPEDDDRTRVLPAVHLGPSDLQVIRRLQRRGVAVYIQPLPRDPRLPPPAEVGGAPADPPQTTQPPPARRSSLLPRPGSVAPAAPAGVDRVQAKLRVVNERGLHLRAAHALAHLAASLPQNVQVANGPDFVNAKSLLGLTTLGATWGTMLDVVVTGPGARAAMDKITSLFATGFGEGVKEGDHPEGDR